MGYPGTDIVLIVEGMMNGVPQCFALQWSALSSVKDIGENTDGYLLKRGVSHAVVSTLVHTYGRKVLEKRKGACVVGPKQSFVGPLPFLGGPSLTVIVLHTAMQPQSSTVVLTEGATELLDAAKAEGAKAEPSSERESSLAKAGASAAAAENKPEKMRAGKVEAAEADAATKERHVAREERTPRE